MENMFSGVTLPPFAYDLILIGFASQSVQSGVRFHGGNSVICSNAAQVARDNLISLSSWNIVDGGLCETIFSNGFESL